MFHLRKASSHLRGAKEGLQVSALHTKWQLPLVMHWRGSRPGGLAAQRLGDSPAPVKVGANEAKTHSISSAALTSRWAPAARSGPGKQVLSRSFHLPPAPQYKEVLYSLAFPQGAVNPILGLKKPPGYGQASKWL